MYILLLLVIYLAFISLGLPDSLLGSGWPAMYEGFNVPLSYAGIITMIISCGTVISSLMSERMTKKFSTKIVTTLSVFLTAVALFGFSVSTRFWMLCLFAIPYGLGAGAIDAALNNYVAIHYSSRHMSWLHCFWGVGAIISPMIMSYSLTNSIWRNGYKIIAIIQFAIAVVLLITFPLWKVNQKKAKDVESSELLGLKGAFKIKGVPFLLFGFFSYSAVEATTMLWASSYLVNARQVTAETAAAYASLFFIGITVGRFAAGFLPDKFSDHFRIRLGLGIALLGVVMILLPLQADILALIGLAVLGFGCAPIYPSIIHSTPANFGADNSQAIIGIQMASAYSGATFMPPLFGLISGFTSLKILPFFLIFFLFLMIFMIEKTFKSVKV